MEILTNAMLRDRGKLSRLDLMLAHPTSNIQLSMRFALVQRDQFVEFNETNFLPQ
jgi:hypothetical protein